MEETMSSSPPLIDGATAPGTLVSAPHRAVGCFYALLSVLQLPLTQFVARERANGPTLPSETESQYRNLAKMGVRTQLLFVRDHWATHFSAALPASVLENVKLLLQLQSHMHFSANVSVKFYQQGIAHVDKLLIAVGASIGDIRQARALKTLLGMANAFEREQDGEDGRLGAFPLSAGNHRMALMQRAKQIMDANQDAACTSDAVDPIAYDKPIRLLSQALEMAATPNQHCKILTLRSECYAKCNELDLARADATAALATNVNLTKWTALKLAGVLMEARAWTEAIKVCDVGLATTPEDEELLSLRNKVLQAMDDTVEILDVQVHVTEMHDYAFGNENESMHSNVVEEAHDNRTSSGDNDDRQSCSLALSFSERNKDERMVELSIDPVHLFAESTQEDPLPLPKLKSKPKKDSKELRTAKSCIEIQDFDEAIYWIDRELVRTKKKPHTHAHLYALRAQCQFGMMQFDKSYQDAQKALEMDPLTVDAYRFASAALFEMERRSEAHSMCTAGRKLDPSNEELKTLEKEICREALAASKAAMPLATVESTAAAQPCSESSSHHSESLSSSSSSSSSSSNWSAPQDATSVVPEIQLPEWKTAVQIGLGFTQTGGFRAADATFTKALALTIGEHDTVDNKVNVLGHRTRCRLAMNRFQAAIDDAREGLKLNPEWLDGHRLVCRGLMGLQRWKEALVECEKVLRDAPQDTNFSTIKKEITFKLTGGTSTTSTRFAPWNPKVQALVHAGLASVQEKKLAAGDTSFTQALAVLNKASRADTDADSVMITQSRVKVLGHRARCRLAMDHFERAAEDARVGISLQADWIDGYRLLCHALMGSSQWQEALVACRRVVKRVPKDVLFQNLQTQLEERCYGTVAAAAPPASPPQLKHDELPTQSEPVDPKCESDAVCGRHHPPDLLQFARDGSIVAQRYLDTQRCLDDATRFLERGDNKSVQMAFRACREALRLWPQLEFPYKLRDELEANMASHDSAIQWGGPMLFFHVQAAIFGDSCMADPVYWQQCIEKYPKDPQLRIRLARVLLDDHDGGGDMSEARDQIETALALVADTAMTLTPALLSTARWLYLRACCTQTELTAKITIITSSPYPWVGYALKEHLQKTQQDEWLTCIAQSCVDDEWMAHACYALGVLYLATRDYARAKQMHFLAKQVDTRRALLGLFPPTTSAPELLDRNALEQAFTGRLMVLSVHDQQQAVAEGTVKCGWCTSSGPMEIPLDQYVFHKLRDCGARPVCSARWD